MYVDGYVVPIVKKHAADYRKVARLACKVWLDHGALEYRECLGDDLNVDMVMPFPKQLKLKRNETVVFAWVVFKSRAHRDRVNAKVMKDPRLNSLDPRKMPFDCKRIVYGGFKVIVDGGAVKTR